MEEKFNLTWRDYKSNVSKSFSSLRHEDNLNDVTLVSDDHIQISAHKVVLSSSSGYFKDIFTKNKHSHPMLCLVGVKSEEVNHVLDYIYYGEVELQQSNIEAFLEVAQKFQLEGLAAGQTEIEMGEEKNEVNEEVNQYVQVEMPASSEDQEEVGQKENEDGKGVFQKVNEDLDSDKIKIDSPPKPGLFADMFQTLEELDNTIDQEIFRAKKGVWQCGRCPRASSNKGHIKEHFEVHIAGLSYPCNFCDKTFRTRSHLRSHQRVCKGIWK